MHEWIEKIPEMYHFTEIVYFILSVYNLPIKPDFNICLTANIN